jgi:transposase-like protein
MALSDSSRSELLNALRVGDGTDLVRELAQWALQQLIEAEAAEKIGANHYERSETQATHRNGTRPLSRRIAGISLDKGPRPAVPTQPR